MPGPAPNPNSVRPRQGAAYVKLPSEGRRGDTPEWPLANQPSLLVEARWERLWRSPQSVMWEKLGIFEEIARYCEVVVLAETTLGLPLLQTAEKFEDRLGLNPMSMLRLRWTVVEDEIAEKRVENEKTARQRFRAVDSKEKAV